MRLLTAFFLAASAGAAPAAPPDALTAPIASPYADFRAGIARFKALPCDILVTAHPDHSGFEEKLASGAFIDALACRNYAAKYEEKLAARLAREGAAAQASVR